MKEIPESVLAQFAAHGVSTKPLEKILEEGTHVSYEPPLPMEYMGNRQQRRKQEALARRRNKNVNASKKKKKTRS
jgi:hypothetical protein